MEVALQVERLSGTEVAQQFDALARLRIAVFREYPYLYEGSLAYERDYLRAFGSSGRSTLVIARDGEQVVGAATAMPLLEHGEADALAPPLVALGYDPAHVYYFGESVLLRSYRGRGIGHAFFDQREAAARAHGFPLATFCAVERPSDHPRRPSDYVPHDAFWTRRGYVRRPDAVANFAWRDLDELTESAKRMVFWLKELKP